MVYMFFTRDVFAVGVSTSSIIGGKQFMIVSFTSLFISVVKNDWKMKATCTSSSNIPFLRNNLYRFWINSDSMMIFAYSSVISEFLSILKI